MKLHDAVKFMLCILVHLKKETIKILRPEDEEDKENTNLKSNTIEIQQTKDGSIAIANDTLQNSLSDPYVVGGLGTVLI